MFILKCLGDIYWYLPVTMECRKDESIDGSRGKYLWRYVRKHVNCDIHYRNWAEDITGVYCKFNVGKGLKLFMYNVGLELREECFAYKSWTLVPFQSTHTNKQTNRATQK